MLLNGDTAQSRRSAHSGEFECVSHQAAEAADAASRLAPRRVQGAALRRRGERYRGSCLGRDAGNGRGRLRFAWRSNEVLRAHECNRGDRAKSDDRDTDHEKNTQTRHECDM